LASKHITCVFKPKVFVKNLDFVKSMPVVISLGPHKDL
jgi:hypothetical protein